MKAVSIGETKLTQFFEAGGARYIRVCFFVFCFFEIGSYCVIKAGLWFALTFWVLGLQACIDMPSHCGLLYTVVLLCILKFYIMKSFFSFGGIGG